MAAASLVSCAMETGTEDAAEESTESREIGVQVSALTTQDISVLCPGNSFTTRSWSDVYASVSAWCKANNPGGPGGASINIYNTNPATLHIRKLEVSYVCKTFGGSRFFKTKTFPKMDIPQEGRFVADAWCGFGTSETSVAVHIESNFL